MNICRVILHWKEWNKRKATHYYAAHTAYLHMLRFRNLIKPAGGTSAGISWLELERKEDCRIAVFVLARKLTIFNSKFSWHIAQRGSSGISPLPLSPPHTHTNSQLIPFHAYLGFVLFFHFSHRLEREIQRETNERTFQPEIVRISSHLSFHTSQIVVSLLV